MFEKSKPKFKVLIVHNIELLKDRAGKLDHRCTIGGDEISIGHTMFLHIILIPAITGCHFPEIHFQVVAGVRPAIEELMLRQKGRSSADSG